MNRIHSWEKDFSKFSLSPHRLRQWGCTGFGRLETEVTRRVRPDAANMVSTPFHLNLGQLKSEFDLSHRWSVLKVDFFVGLTTSQINLSSGLLILTISSPPSLFRVCSLPHLQWLWDAPQGSKMLGLPSLFLPPFLPTGLLPCLSCI